MPTAPEDSFIPLTPGSFSPADRPDFRVTVVSQANVQSVSALHQCGASASTAPPSANEPRVTFQREGDRVSVISIHCPCGRTIELACDYPDVETPEAGAEKKS
jgi:hypothetical protein